MLRVQNLSKTYPSPGQESVPAIRDISFELKAGEFYALLGPSGCGKSTTLRSIAGFETPEAGEIWIGNQLVFSSFSHVNLLPNKRDFGIVFQSYAVWPHMSVFGNVAFPLLHGRKKVHKREVKERVTRALQLVQLEMLADRPAPLISGGQQQRVALARALVLEPTVMLLDEPLSNLDAKLREAMRLEIRELIKRLNITTLYVTHDQLEGLTMADRLAVMNAGQIIQEGSPLDIYKNPGNQFVANFIGLANFLEGRLSAISANSVGDVKTPSGMVRCVLPKEISVGDPVVIMIRPEDIAVFRDGPTPEINVFKGKVKTAVFTGEILDCWVTVSHWRLRIKVHPSVLLKPEEEILIHFLPERCRVIPGSS